MRKSTWPSRDETARLTVVVIILSIVAAFFLGGLDQIFEQTFSRFVLNAFATAAPAYIPDP